jgi:hypothetical protein
MMLEAYMRWGLEHPNAYQLVYCMPRPATASWPEDAHSDLSEQCYAIFSGVVGEIAAEGRLRDGSADSAAQALWMACHGVVALLIARPKIDWADHEELMRVTLEGMLHGLVAN